MRGDCNDLLDACGRQRSANVLETNDVEPMAGPWLTGWPFGPMGTRAVVQPAIVTAMKKAAPAAASARAASLVVVTVALIICSFHLGGAVYSDVNVR